MSDILLGLELEVRMTLSSEKLVCVIEFEENN